jgi:hypothetical protein
MNVASEGETLASLATLAGTMTPADAAVSTQEADAAADERAQTANVWRNGEQALFGMAPNNDPAAVIRRMSLSDKMTFFA